MAQGWQGGPGQPGMGAPPPGAPPGGYGPPPGMGAPPRPPMQAGSDKGFFGGLFDFSFTTFVATRVLKVLYGLVLLLLGLGLLVGLAGAVMALIDEPLAGIALLFAVPIGAVIYLILIRCVFELYIVIFRIAEMMAEIRDERRARH